MFASASFVGAYRGTERGLWRFKSLLISLRSGTNYSGGLAAQLERDANAESVYFTVEGESPPAGAFHIRLSASLDINAAKWGGAHHQQIVDRRGEFVAQYNAGGYEAWQRGNGGKPAPSSKPTLVSTPEPVPTLTPLAPANSSAPTVSASITPGCEPTYKKSETNTGSAVLKTYAGAKFWVVNATRWDSKSRRGTLPGGKNRPVNFQSETRSLGGKQGRVISLDCNSVSGKKEQLPPIVVYPTTHIPEEKAAAQACLTKMEAFLRKHVAAPRPKGAIKTTAANGRGVEGYFHTEFFSINDDEAVAAVLNNRKEYAQILASTLGKISHAIFIVPHGDVRRWGLAPGAADRFTPHHHTELSIGIQIAEAIKKL